MKLTNNEAWQLYEKRICELKKMRESILATSSLDLKIDKLKDVYSFLKNIGPDFYSLEENKLHEYYDGLIHYTRRRLESAIPNRFIVDIPKFKEQKIRFPKIEFEEAILDFLVTKTRSYIYKKYKKISDLPFELSDFENYCRRASYYISFLCFIHGIPEKRFKIEPGFIKHSMLYLGGGWHYFNIIVIGSKKFLIDCTYSQFFLEKRCLKERLGVMELPGPAAGTFMTTKNRKAAAEQLLNRGWIELKDGVLKDYLDGFAISNRNALYYEDNALYYEDKDVSYETDYTDDDYWRFIMHKDSQTNHEDIETLGYQYRPLKNPKMKF